jgi:hypothetical protein
VPLPLVDLIAAPGCCGIPYVLRDHAVRQLRRFPRVADCLSRLLGKRPIFEEG